MGFDYSLKSNIRHQTDISDSREQNRDLFKNPTRLQPNTHTHVGIIEVDKNKQPPLAQAG